MGYNMTEKNRHFSEGVEFYVLKQVLAVLFGKLIPDWFLTGQWRRS